MFDTEKIQDLTLDLHDADTKIRKSIKLPDGLENPARTVSDLLGLAATATRAAQALAICMASDKDRELLEAQLRKRA